MAIVSLLENERAIDRMEPQHEEPLQDLFAQLGADKLVEEMVELVEADADMASALPIVREYRDKLDTAKKVIQESFIYYSRMATVGTIAQMLIHEIRNRTIAFGVFMQLIADRFGPFKDKRVDEEFRSAQDAISALERLADTFSPLASRGFRRRIKNAILEERINSCMTLLKGDIKEKKIKCMIPRTETRVAVDPGELDGVLLNLIANATYWLGQIQGKERKLEFQIKHIQQNSRVRVSVHDNGPGVEEDYAKKIFMPGITRKPGGIGMGLTVASELVAEYGGKMTVIPEGILGGATFSFDIPIKN